MTPAATVCVSTYNRAARLSRLLEALAAQDVVGGVEVVVYDDASTDSTGEVLRSWSRRLDLTPLRGTLNAGPAHGRNLAWQAARAALVLFTDDDCVPTPGWIAAHQKAAAKGTVTVGRTLPNPEQEANHGPFSRSLVVEDAALFHTCNIGYPRALLAALGGFDERYRRAAGEDTDLGLRAVGAGARVSFVPEALVFHDVRPSSWWAALRETAKWADVPLFASQHPAEASIAVWSEHWWRRSHPYAALAGAGLIGATRHPVALLALLPWLRLRTGELQVNARRRHWPWVLPAQLVLDLAEIAVLARGSARHGRLLL